MIKKKEEEEEKIARARLLAMMYRVKFCCVNRALASIDVKPSSIHKLIIVSDFVNSICETNHKYNIEGILSLNRAK